MWNKKIKIVLHFKNGDIKYREVDRLNSPMYHIPKWENLSARRFKKTMDELAKPADIYQFRATTDKIMGHVVFKEV